MKLQNIYSPTVQQQLKDRISLLREDSTPNWGKMNSAQMLAHLNVMFKIALDDQQKRPNALVRFILQALVKKNIINNIPYKKNGRTAPEMLIEHQPDFKAEQEKVIYNLNLVNDKGEKSFDQKLHPSFGKLSSKEWSNLFYKHIDHHLNQFGI